MGKKIRVIASSGIDFGIYRDTKGSHLYLEHDNHGIRTDAKLVESNDGIIVFECDADALISDINEL